MNFYNKNASVERTLLKFQVCLCSSKSPHFNQLVKSGISLLGMRTNPLRICMRITILNSKEFTVVDINVDMYFTEQID